MGRASVTVVPCPGTPRTSMEPSLRFLGGIEMVVMCRARCPLRAQQLPWRVPRRHPGTDLPYSSCLKGQHGTRRGRRYYTWHPLERRQSKKGRTHTMEQDFYRGRLREHYGLEVLIPSAEERQVVHEVIYGELVRGHILPKSRQAYARIIASLVAQGAQGIVLGCTEIMLLISQEDSPVPVFDTTTITCTGRRRLRAVLIGAQSGWNIRRADVRPDRTACPHAAYPATGSISHPRRHRYPGRSGHATKRGRGRDIGRVLGVAPSTAGRS